jgi:uncharacterized membrane protein YoaK (UPF0700 family)
VALVLSALTGFVDAVSYDRFLGVFPANQSGNAVFLGTAIGGANHSTGWRSGTSIVAFALGVVVGEILRRRVHPPRTASALLGFELVLLAVVVAVAGPIDSAQVIGGAEGYVLVVLTSMAMGVQTTVIRHVASTAVSTTYITGAIDRMGAAVSRVMARESRLRDERAVMVLLGVLVTYVGGAALGAAPPGEWEWSMALAAGVVAVVGVVWMLVPRRLLAPGEDAG